MNEIEMRLIDTLKVIYQTDNVAILHRLSGGMSNYTYVVSVGGAKKVVRIPGENAEKFVDRHIERQNLQIIEQITPIPKTEYFNETNGIKITPYVEGTSLHLTDDFDFREIARILRSLHEKGRIAVNDYDPYGRLELYERYAKEVGHRHEADYYRVKEHFYRYVPYLKSFPLTLCHGDAQRSNFVKQSDGTIFLVDYEFCGNNDLYYDIACFGNREIELGYALLEVYFDRPVTDEDKHHFLLWHAFQALQWHNVAWFKHLTGLSEKLGFDFSLVAKKYLKSADDSLKQADLFRQ